MGIQTRDRVRKHRKMMAQSGMRPIQIWVPDTKRPEFVRECRRQSRLLLNDAQEREILDFIGAASDTEGWE
ncbi:MAG: DUF3018 family protein [Synergistales bacterium]|nr:DUF3018 family protein [Synergistales bacterium]